MGCAVPVTVYHTSHEGSHAIVESLSNYPCVFSLSEYLTHENSEPALNAFLNKKGLDIEGLLAGLQMNDNVSSESLHIMYKDIKSCQASNQILFFVALLYQLPRAARYSPHLRVIPLVRTDVMRLALARDKDEVKALGSGGHPHHIDEVHLRKHHFVLEDLRGEIEIIQKNYISKVETLKNAKAWGIPCSSMIIIFYEDYVINTEDFIFRIYKFLRRVDLNKTTNETTSILQQQHNLNISSQQIHPYDFTTFVANDVEVLNLFLSEPYLSFGNILGEAGLQCDLTDLLLTS
jgi:hypothetical protein